MVNELSQTEVYNTSDKFYVTLILEKNQNFRSNKAMGEKNGL